MEITSSHNCAVLVLSCDKYSDIWPPFFNFFDRYWPNCPYPVYLGTNNTPFQHPKVKTIFSHRNTTWSDELEVILHQITEKYIIIILEDYFISKAVNNNEINELIFAMKETNAAYIKLAAFPKKYDNLWPHTKLEKFPNLASIHKGSKYRVCLQAALWDKYLLQELLNTSENPWQFEIEASKRSNTLSNDFLCVIANPVENKVHGPITYYCTALSAGKWMQGAINLCKKENIPVDLSVRSIENFAEYWERKVYIALPIPLRKVVDFIRNKASKIF